MRLGIDFGTCYSSAALQIEGVLHPVKDPLKPLESCFPSSVCFTKKGEILIGHAAENQHRLDPKHYCQEFKRNLGQDFPYYLGERRMLPEELVSIILQGLKREAEKMVNSPLNAAIITVPATYLSHKRQLMLEAAEKAGFEEVDLLEEPVAAAIYYVEKGIEGHYLAEGEILLVYDLGGGTFDAALIQKQSDGYKLLCQPVGNQCCGGIDFERKIFQDLKYRYFGEDSDLELLDPQRQDLEALRAKFNLEDWCHNFKHQLSIVSEYEDLPPIDSASKFYSLNRERFEGMIAPYIDDTCELCQQLVQQSGLNWEKINRILLVGGSCRIPLVQERLSQKFHRPVVRVDDPELAICFGAAIDGAQRKEKEVEKQPLQPALEPPQSITDFGVKKHPMLQSNKLLRFKEYGDGILQKLQEYDSAIKEWSLQEDKITEDLRRCIEDLKNAARQVVDKASSPVKIGVMGEFKASKTTILGSLLGYAGILPDSEVASTGNVTYLRIVQEESLQTTQFQFSVEYLDRFGALSCLKFMLAKVKSKAEAAQLPQEQLARLQHFNTKNSEVWEKVVRWCKEAKSPNNNPGFEKALKELEVFAKSCQLYGEYLFGKSYPINVDTARAGLQLPEDPLAALDQCSFDQIPPENEKFPKFLKATFALIQRIDVEVRVSKEIWDLSSLQGANKLVLLDFPGLGAEGSGVRDQFLSQREMENVQTILVLTYALRPGDAKALEIFDMLQQQRQNQSLKDFILVGVGRFDQLPVEEEELDLLIAEKEQLTEQTVQSKLPVLNAAIRSARSYAERDDRILLLSAFLALDAMKEDYTSSIKVASSEILNKLNEPSFQSKSNRLRQKWKQLSQKLKESNSDSMLAWWLEEVASDGGICQLRRLLEKHVAAHGLNQLYQDARRQVEILREQQRQLQEKLDDPEWTAELQAAENSNLYDLKKHLRDLDRTYNDLKVYLQKSSFELGVGIDEKRNGIPLRQVVEDEVNLQIFSWGEWRDLFNRVKTSGKIEVDRKEKRILTRRFDKAPQRTIPTKTDDFYPIFQSTAEKLEKYTRELIRRAIKNFLKELSDERITLQGGKIVDLTHIRNQLGECLPSSTEKNDLISFACPIQWEEDILNIFEEHDSLRTIKQPKTMFPLALTNEETNKIGLIFDWAPEKSRTNHFSENHHILVLQLRDALISSLSYELVQLVSKANQEFNNILRQIFDDNIEDLRYLLDNKPELRRMATGELKSEGASSEWLGVLKELVSIQNPL